MQFESLYKISVRKRKNRRFFLFGCFIESFSCVLSANRHGFQFNLGFSFRIDGVISPYFDEMKITVKELSAADLETFYRKAQRTRSPNTVIKFHANIRESLQWGIRRGYVLTNVADVAEKPKKEPFLPHFYNLDKMKKLLDEVRGTQLEFAVVMTCHYGLRREEIVGLKWDAIDFQYKQIEIKHIVTEAVVDGHYQQISLDRAKTEKSLPSLPQGD